MLQIPETLTICSPIPITCRYHSNQPIGQKNTPIDFYYEMQPLKKQPVEQRKKEGEKNIKTQPQRLRASFIRFNPSTQNSNSTNTLIASLLRPKKQRHHEQNTPRCEWLIYVPVFLGREGGLKHFQGLCTFSKQKYGATEESDRFFLVHWSLRSCAAANFPDEVEIFRFFCEIVVSVISGPVIGEVVAFSRSMPLLHQFAALISCDLYPTAPPILLIPRQT